jgi:quercetin dioxygenase-like cupin family protein
MPIVFAPDEPTHQVGPARFTSLATPSRGSTDTAVWMVELEAGAPGTPHSLTREEIFVVLAGSAHVQMDGEVGVAGAGDAIVLPPGVRFELSNPGSTPARLVCVLPVGGEARLDDGTTFAPPWSE